MAWLNYHHLLYFWTVAKEGGMSAAAKKLRVTQPTVSGQIRELEETMGGLLFHRKGSSLVMTPLGQRVFSYADEIFTLGQELMATVADPSAKRPVRLVVGVVEVIPKLVAFRLLEPVTRMQDPTQLVVREGRLDRLLSMLSLHELDLVISDAPVSPHVHLRAYNHSAGESDIGVYASAGLAAGLSGEFPGCLEGAPFLALPPTTSLQRAFDYWCEQERVSPRVVGEFDDSALLKAFAAAGKGLFAGPLLIEAELRTMYGLELIGRCDGVKEHYYAISVERKIQHPAVLEVVRSAARFGGRGR